MVKTMAVEEHKRKVGRLYYRHRKVLAETKDQCYREAKQELTLKTGWMREIVEAFLAVECWLKNHSKKIS